MITSLISIVAEPHHFNAGPGKNFDAAPAPTLPYSRPTFLKSKKVNNIGLGLFSNGFLGLQ
jgi:hypothetical protein